MTILEATVEITKAAVSRNTGSNTIHGNELLLIDEKERKEFLTGIEELYKKLEKLDENKLKH